MFNKTKKRMEKDLKKAQKTVEKKHDKQMERCIPIVREILKMLVDEKVAIGDVTDQQGDIKKKDKENHDYIAKKVLALYLEKNIKYKDKEMITKLLLQSVELIMNKVIDSLEIGYTAVVERALGCTMLDLDIVKMDEVLKKPLPTKEKVQENNDKYSDD